MPVSHPYGGRRPQPTASESDAQPYLQRCHAELSRASDVPGQCAAHWCDARPHGALGFETATGPPVRADRPAAGRNIAQPPLGDLPHGYESVSAQGKGADGVLAPHRRMGYPMSRVDMLSRVSQA